MMKLIPSLEIERLKFLPLSKLRLVKRSFEKYFYSSGVNIGLHNAFLDKKTDRFREKVGKAISKQINSIAKVETIDAISRNFNKLDNKTILVGIALYWFALNEVIDGKTVALTAFILWAGSQGGQSGLDKIVPDRQFKLEDETIKNRLLDRVEFMVGAVDKTTQIWIAQVIEDGMKKGWNAERIAKYLKDESKSISIERADLITETELSYAFNLVEMETFKRNDIEMHKWVTELDEKTCIFCVGNEEAGYIRVGDIFPSGVANPPGHLRCRCYLLPKLPLVIEGEIWTGK